MARTILVVDDEPTLRETIVEPSRLTASGSSRLPTDARPDEVPAERPTSSCST
jgi:hypothetical protein